MTCCCSRYTFGIILGAVNLVFSVIGLISEWVALSQLDEIKDTEARSKAKRSSIQSMIVCAISIPVSALFIFAIVKRKYKFVTPWIILCVSGVIGAGKIIYYASSDISNDVGSKDENVALIVVSVIVIVIEIAIIWFSHTLQQKLRSEYNAKLSNIPVRYETQANDYTAVPSKA